MENICVYICTLQSDPSRVNHVENVLLPALKRIGFNDVTVFSAVEACVSDQLEKACSSLGLKIDPNYIQRYASRGSLLMQWLR